MSESVIQSSIGATSVKVYQQGQMVYNHKGTRQLNNQDAKFPTHHHITIERSNTHATGTSCSQ
jgi:microcystin-dependent protein